ncbi:MAG: C45 family autoproteolytic acyltransferase/hydrolase [Acidimicrobiia bacterium]
MNCGPLRVLEIYGDTADFGRIHGSECKPLIRDYLDERLGLSGDAIWAGRSAQAGTVLALAETTLTHHQSYSPTLYEEMLALAEAAGITSAEAVVVGGFTDLVDVVRAHDGWAPIEDDCTALLDPVNGVLAQTWDMHASAGEYVVMLKLDPLSGPAAVVQTTAGCLGQIGMNEAGIGVGINNLTSIGKPGVTWPFVVRKVLEQTTLDDAIDSVLSADLAGGHNYLIVGPDGAGANIEAMPGTVEVTPVAEMPFVHTNHCLDPGTRLEEGARSPEHVVGSQTRLDRGSDLARDLDAFFSDPAIARRAESPHDVATCGAVVIRPMERRLDSVWGIPGDAPWESFRL